MVQGELAIRTVLQKYKQQQTIDCNLEKINLIKLIKINESKLMYSNLQL